MAAFLKRFEMIQAAEVGSKHFGFRAALELAGERCTSTRLRVTSVERLGELKLRSEPNEWAEVGEARHRVAHVHPAG